MNENTLRLILVLDNDDLDGIEFDLRCVCLGPRVRDTGSNCQSMQMLSMCRYICNAFICTQSILIIPPYQGTLIPCNKW